MRILILEDDLMVADLLEEGLTDAGHAVCGIAATTAEAVAIARRHRPDVAVVDINLGAGGRGTAFPRLLAATWPLGVLFASGTGFTGDLAACGGTGVILKPYAMADLLDSLAVVGDIAATGATARPLPRGLRLA